MAAMKTKLSENHRRLIKMPLIYGVTILLWLLTSFFAFWQIMTVRALVIRLATRYYHHQGMSLLMANVNADPFGKITAIIMTVIAIFVVVFGSDYHFDYAGQSKSWKFFAGTFGYQIALFALVFFL
jgi:hypothetical protein